MAKRRKTRVVDLTPTSYFERTHRPLNCLAFIFPLLVAHEVGELLYSGRALAPRYLAWFMGLFGATWQFVPPLLIVLVLLIWHVAAKEKWRVDFDAVGGMIAESLLLWIPLVGLNMLLDRLLIDPAGGPGPVVAFLQAVTSGPDSQLGLTTRVLNKIGAGIYEEFLYRLVGINLILLVTVDILKLNRKWMIVLAIVVLSVAFGLVHLVGPPPVYPKKAIPIVFQCVFPMLAAGYLSIVFVARGFGVAVGAHACYNIAMMILSRGA